MEFARHQRKDFENGSYDFTSERFTFERYRDISADRKKFRVLDDSLDPRLIRFGSIRATIFTLRMNTNGGAFEMQLSRRRASGERKNRKTSKRVYVSQK